MPKSVQKAVLVQIVNINKDKIECKKSDGHRWSYLKNSCISPKMQAIQLTNIADPDSKSYVLTDGSDMEIFATELPHSVILLKQKDPFLWKKANWEIRT